MKTAVKSLPPSNLSLAEVVKYGTNKQRTDFEIDLAYAQKKEQSEKEKRSKNLVIFGLKNSEKSEPLEKAKEDEDEIIKLLSVVDEGKRSKIRRTIRLRSNISNRPAPILIEFESVDEARRVLKNAKKLKGANEYRGVFIAEDQTFAERAAYKRLATVCKNLNDELSADSPFMYKIRGGEVTAIDKSTSKVYRTGRPNNQ